MSSVYTVTRDGEPLVVVAHDKDFSHEEMRRQCSFLDSRVTQQLPVAREQARKDGEVFATEEIIAALESILTWNGWTPVCYPHFAGSRLEDLDIV